jgi:chitinase
MSIRLFALFCVLFYSVLLTPAFSASTKKQAEPNSRFFVGYYETWSEPWVADPADSRLVKLPDYVNVVILSFMKPEGTYTPGSFDLSGSGIQLPYDGAFFKTVIDKFKETHPNTKILIAVGGANYWDWDHFNVDALAALVKDYNLDGADIDYEKSPNCVLGSDKHISCDSDKQYIQLVKTFREALPKPLWVTAAAWSIGAYGEDQWTDSLPQGDHTGMMLNTLREVGDQIDLLNVMSYDAGDKNTTGYDPVEAMAAYQHYFKGNIVMGVEISPESWGGHVGKLSDVETLGQAVIQQNAAGMMLWSLQKKPMGVISAENPDAELAMKKICEVLELGAC